MHTPRQFIPTLHDIFGNATSLVIAWMAALLAMPIVQWAVVQPGPIAAATLGVLLQASLVVLLLAQAASARRAAFILVVVVVASWVVEAVGSQIGLPFGAYAYTDKLQPQLLGVPLLIPLAWLMMLPQAWAISQRITGKTSGFLFVVVSALAFTAWDLFLDPQMVHWGLWGWARPGAYFGIPLANYAGWLLVSALITALARPPTLPSRPLMIMYALTWLIETVGQMIFWQLHGPAVCGFIGMGVFAVLAWQGPGIRRRLRR